jgi:monoamine oxidase
LLHAIGLMGGTAALYQMMTTFGHAAESRFPGPPNLAGARKGASVIVLGRGPGWHAGPPTSWKRPATASRILEYQKPSPAAGTGTLRGGDKITEMGGATQTVQFRQGQTT